MGFYKGKLFLTNYNHNEVLPPLNSSGYDQKD